MAALAHDLGSSMAEKNSPDAQSDPLPSPQRFCLTVPLYKQFLFDKKQRNPFYLLEHYKGVLDCHCHGCKGHSVFNRINMPEYSEFAHADNYVTALWFGCSRNTSHQICFVFHSHQGILQKIGQYPSIADLASPGLQKYRPVLGDDGLGELTRAVGLAAHGVGAFVYLRRIFEALIEKARQAAAIEPAWDESAFEKSRMDEKIAMLKQHLPEFLVENRKLYGIMSVGVHTLSEEQCLEAFPIVRIGIELILDERLGKHAREQKIAEATKQISKLGTELKSK